MSSSGGSSGGAVSSVFGRAGAVTAQAGDYTAAEVTDAAATNAQNNFTAIQSFSAAVEVAGQKFYSDQIQGYSGSTINCNTNTLSNIGHIGVVSSAPAPPANPLVSGTVYQNTSGGPITVIQSVTATAVTTMQMALGSAAAPGKWGGADTIASGDVKSYTLRVPNNWYYSFTCASATFATAQVVQE